MKGFVFTTDRSLWFIISVAVTIIVLTILTLILDSFKGPANEQLNVIVSMILPGSLYKRQKGLSYLMLSVLIIVIGIVIGLMVFSDFRAGAAKFFTDFQVNIG